MIISTGVDLAEVKRIQAALEDARIGARFRGRVFTAKEIEYCEKKQRRTGGAKRCPSSKAAKSDGARRNSTHI